MNISRFQDISSGDLSRFQDLSLVGKTIQYVFYCAADSGQVLGEDEPGIACFTIVNNSLTQLQISYISLQTFLGLKLVLPEYF